MTSLLLAATPIEIAPIMETIRDKKVLKQIPDIDVLIGGIGLTATTYALTKYLHLKRPDCIIQAGVGGCFDLSMPLATVVAVKNETIADQSVMELKTLKTLFDLKLLPEEQPPFKKGKLPNDTALIKLFKGKKVNGISVNEITTDKKRVRIYEQQFSPIVESMEGAALHYVARMEKIPFIQLRAISNYIAERNKKKWNMKEAISNLNEELLKLLMNIQKKY
ncbi:MAG: futalosine hydrolase [Bacteroidetes bacterium]|nr:futalosine hydrolase [Bacteroidota bacterium]